MNKCVETKDLFDCQVPYLTKLFASCRYPWEMLPLIKGHIKILLEEQLEGFEDLGGNRWIGEHVKIYQTATIEGPCIIGPGTEIRPGAFIRGNVIAGKNCVIGNSTELKNCILLDGVQVPHYNYVGDSILGNYAHMGAGAICSNLKADKKEVVIHGEEEYETGIRKVGSFLGDGADIGCGCILNPGTVVGQNTAVYPGLVLRGVYPADCIVKERKNYIQRVKDGET